MKFLLLRSLLVPLGVSPTILLVWLAIFFSRTERSSEMQEPRQEGSTLEFFPAPRMRILIGLIQFALLAFSAALVASVPAGSSLYAVLGPLSVLAAILVAKPRAVLLDDNGIRQKRWIRGECEIAWNEIAWLKRGRNTGTTYVKSKNGGRPISFSRLLVGQSRFEREVRAHAKASLYEE
jgi:hypothetical protein